MTVEKWREGISFDLAALKNVTDWERASLVKTLQERLDAVGDWREIQALGEIGTTDAKEAIRRAIEHGSPETCLYAAEQLAKMNETEHLEHAIIEALRKASLFGGLSQALDMAEENPSPLIQETLLDLALNGLGGKAEEVFDWNHRPFFLRFGDNDRNIQIEAYKELCARLGVTPRVPAER